MKRILLLVLVYSVNSVSAAEWEADVAPYLWATSLKGQTQIGPRTVQVSAPFSKLIKLLDFGGMLWISGHRDNLGVFFNGVYSKVSGQKNIKDISIELGSKLTLGAVGVSYILMKEGKWIPEPYAGARYTKTVATLTASNNRQSISAQQTEGWTDAIFGSRLSYLVNPSWTLEGAADYGIGNNSNSYNLHALIGYQSLTKFKNTRFYLGYRYLHQNFHTGQGRTFYRWDMSLYGPVLGFMVQF